MWELIRASKPLDENSMYCNLIQCDHFADTCVVAELDGEIVGWISAYIKPGEPETVFVWQVAVSEKARGMGVGSRMLTELLERDACRDVTTCRPRSPARTRPAGRCSRAFATVSTATWITSRTSPATSTSTAPHATEHMVTIDLAAEGMKKAA